MTDSMAPGFRRRDLAVILFLAFALRLTYGLLLAPTPAARYLLIDSAFYAGRAAAIARGEGFGPGPYFMSPGYPYLLAPLYRVFGGGTWVIGLFQSLVGTASVLGLGLLARRWFDTRVALVAMLLAAVYGPFWFYDWAILTASPILAGSILLLLLLERLVDRPGAVLALVAGGVAGGVALLRPTVLLFVLAVPWLVRHRAPATPARLFRLGLLVWLGAALAIAPVTIRNLIVSGELVPISTNLGMNFFTGNHPDATGIYAGAPFVTSYEPEFERADFLREAERRSGRPMNDIEASRFWLAEGLRAIAAHPGAAARRTLSKLLMVFHHVETQNNLSIYMVRDMVPLLFWNPFGFRLLAPLGLAGLALCVSRRRSRLALFGLAFAASQLLAMLLFFVSSEYRLPLLILLIPAAAGFLVSLGDGLGAARPLTRSMPRAAWVLLAVGLALACRETELTRRLASRRVDYLNFATLAESHGELTEALALLDKSLAIDPDFLPALTRRVSIARRMGLKAEAAASEARLAALPRQAGSSDPLLWDVDRAVALYRSGRYADALAVFSELARGRAQDPRLLNNIGLCLYKLERLDEAEAVLIKAAERDPGYLRARHNLGLVREAAGRLAEAESTWRGVLEQDPGNRRTRERLARLYQALGDSLRAAAEIESLAVGQGPAPGSER